MTDHDLVCILHTRVRVAGRAKGRLSNSRSLARNLLIVYGEEVAVRAVMGAGLMLANLVQSTPDPLTSQSVATFAQSLTGSVLLYNVSGEPREGMTPAFGLWTQLEVRTAVQLFVCTWLRERERERNTQQDGIESSTMTCGAGWA